MLKNLKLSAKLILFFSLVSLLSILAIGASCYYLAKDMLEKKTQEELKEIISTTQMTIQKTVEVQIKNYLGTIAERAYLQAQSSFQKVAEKGIKKEEAFKILHDMLLDPLYGKVGETGYLAVVNSKGVATVHPKVEGKDLSNLPFMIKAIQTKNGFIEYKWRNPGELTERDKIGALRYFEPYDAIIWVSSYKSEFMSLFKIEDLAEMVLTPKMDGLINQYIIDKNGTVVLHSDKYLKTLANEKDAEGNFYIKKICDNLNGSMVVKQINQRTKEEEDVLLSYSHIANFDWVVVSSVKLNDLYAPVVALRNIIFIISLLVFVVAIIVSIVLRRSLAKPIQELTTEVQSIEKGNLLVNIKIQSADEIGILARAFKDMITSLAHVIIAIRQNSQILIKSSGDLINLATNLAISTDGMTQQANSVASASEQLSQNVNAFASTTEQMNMNISNVASSSEEMAQTVKTVSQALIKIVKAIESISEYTQEVSLVAQRAREMALSATQTMDNLGVSANEIGEVTSIIKQIAVKTNLLALNATIEAASAGEAGRGFAVVATEIKELANQSAKAAERISNKVNVLQSNSRESIHTISQISEIIINIHNLESNVSSSVMEQRTAIENISRNLEETEIGIQSIAKAVSELTIGSGDLSKNAGEAATATGSVADSILSVSRLISNNNNHTLVVKEAAENLTQIADKLMKLVEKFII